MMKVLIILTTVLAIWSFSRKEAVGQTMHVPIMLHTTAELHCVYHIREERILAAQWYKSSKSDVFVEDEVAVAWWYFGDTTGSLQGYTITPDFALVIRNVNITDGGLYRCAITPSGNVADYTYDVNIEVYALPKSSPTIEYDNQAVGSRVSCSVKNIYPNVSSKFNLLSGSAKSDERSVVNDDGTFNMTATTYIPCSGEDLAVECSYSNLNYDSSSFLRIPSCLFNVSDPTRGLWIGWTTLGVDCVIFIAIMAIAFGVLNGRLSVSCFPHTQEGVPQKDVRGMNKMPHFAALMGISHVILFISAVVFLATI